MHDTSNEMFKSASACSCSAVIGSAHPASCRGSSQLKLCGRLAISHKLLQMAMIEAKEQKAGAGSVAGSSECEWDRNRGSEWFGGISSEERDSSAEKGGNVRGI